MICFEMMIHDFDLCKAKISVKVGYFSQERIFLCFLRQKCSKANWENISGSFPKSDVNCFASFTGEQSRDKKGFISVIVKCLGSMIHNRK